MCLYFKGRENGAVSKKYISQKIIIYKYQFFAFKNLPDWNLSDFTYNYYELRQYSSIYQWHTELKINLCKEIPDITHYSPSEVN